MSPKVKIIVSKISTSVSSFAKISILAEVSPATIKISVSTTLNSLASAEPALVVKGIVTSKDDIAESVAVNCTGVIELSNILSDENSYVTEGSVSLFKISISKVSILESKIALNGVPAVTEIVSIGSNESSSMAVIATDPVSCPANILTCNV